MTKYGRVLKRILKAESLIRIATLEKVGITGRSLIALEFILLCILVPGVIMTNKWAIYLFLFLWLAGFYAYFIMRRIYRESIREMWNWSAVNRQNLKPMLIRWMAASVGMAAFIYLYDADKLFGLVHFRPEIIPFLLVFYPLLSALPQEMIFCSFFFRRYRVLFGTGRKMLIASAIVFAYAHLLYINPVAPTLSLLGGLIFASTYLKTKSLALVTIEHGLYGNAMFVVGLGYYFYSGNVH